MSTLSDLGRRHGVWISTEDVELHLLNGWRLVNDGDGFAEWDGRVLMEHYEMLERAA
jgi:hypothetical protein